MRAIGELKMNFFFFLTFFILVINAVETNIFFNPCVPVISGGADEAVFVGIILHLFMYSGDRERQSFVSSTWVP